MGKKGKRRGKAAATGAPEEVAERDGPEASAAAADSATPRKSRRRGRVAQEASATVHALDPSDAGKGTTDGEKKPKLDERKKNKGESGDDGTDGEDVLGDAEVGQKRKRNKKNMQERSSSLVSDDNAIEADKSGILCKNVEDVPGVDEASRPPKNEEVSVSSAVNTAEQEVPKGKKPKLGKRNKNKHELSFSAVVDAAVVVGKSENDSSDGKCVPGVAEISTSPKNGENQDCPEVNIVDKETLERKKPKLRKWKKNKQGRSPAAVSDDGAVDTDKSDNVCTDGDDASRDAQVSMSTVEDPNCPEVNIAEKGTREKKTPKPKKPKPKKPKNNKEGSPSVVLDNGAVVADESGNSSMNGDDTPQDVEASISPRNAEDPTGPGVNIADKGVPEMKKPKIKKWKKKIQGQSPSALLDAGVVLPDKSGRGDTNVEAASGGADVTTSPRPGEGPQYPDVNVTGHMVEENKVNKDYSQEPKFKKKKQDQSPFAVPDTGAVVADEIGNGYIEGEGLPGDAEISTNPRNGRRPDCPEVNITKDLVEGKNGNNDNSQKPKRKKRKRKKRAQVAVTEAPVAVDVSSDERKDVCRTGTMKVSESMGSSICESEVTAKNVVRDIYSPRGSLARFQRKKLLILDLNGLLADITPVHHDSHLAHGKVRGKYVFIRPYHDDFLRFCFQNFELGVWSSRWKVNVDDVVDILMKDLRRHLLFCWDASYCTTTKCNTLENQRKPLVLKELKKLWNKEDPDLPWEQGDFSPSNTLLVDDSPYKALGNPPHTAIFPQPYSYHNRTDNSLGPGGDIRVYLENLAAADDVQRYVQEHPFGQPFITESDPNWNFYAKILGGLENHDRLEKLAA